MLPLSAVGGYRLDGPSVATLAPDGMLTIRIDLD
jgi:hypothetical protein